MHFTVNVAFMNYFYDVLVDLGKQILLNWTTQEQILPISLETFEINPYLINAPKTLQDLAIRYKNKKNTFAKEERSLDVPKENDSKFQSFLNSFIADVLIFTAALITLIIALMVIYVLYRQSKLKALVTNIAMQRIKAVEAADTNSMLCTCKTQWYIMGMLIIITLGMLYLVTNKIRKTSFCKGHLFSNNTKILLFLSNAHSYVPVKFPTHKVFVKVSKGSVVGMASKLTSRVALPSKTSWSPPRTRTLWSTKAVPYIGTNVVT